ncbi:MAG: hypothetical protein PHY93_07665 [Bacteriovorax sp.]|nr:hypothetical protein [Bacteriovorax sp.]
MKKRILTVLTALSLTASTSFACDIAGKSGFAPENNLRISQWDKATNGMTQERFLAIVKSVSDIYAPIVKKKGGILSMNNKWSDDTVNASAQRNGNTWVVNMYGGLARHTLTTDDGFALVVCHELGHHIGGAPRKGSSWAANEGQADYFGAMKCLRRVLEKQDNITAVSKMTVDAEATKQCEMIYKNADEVALCQRISMAGKSLGSLLGSLGGSSNVNFTTPDASIVTKTNDAHPAAQCRLDTYFNGILCDKSYDQDTDNNDPKIGTCIARDGYKAGTRPLCWYKPSSSEI